MNAKSRATHHAPRTTCEAPERSCIITREAQPKEGLLRFVVAPDGVLVLDLGGKLPGRGVYVTASRLAVAEAIAKKAFARAAKQPVTIPEGFLEFVGYQLRQRCLEALSMARKAGQAISGFDKVEEAIGKGKVVALVQASDAGEDGVRKLQKSAPEHFNFFTRAVLSQVMGRENAVHLAILEGPAGAFFIENARRFALFLE